MLEDFFKNLNIKNKGKFKKVYITKDEFKAIDAATTNQVKTGSLASPTETCYVNNSNNHVFMNSGKNLNEMKCCELSNALNSKNITVQEFVDIAMANQNFKALTRLEKHLKASSQSIVFGKNRKVLRSYLGSPREALCYSAYGLSKNGVVRPLVHMILQYLPSYKKQDKHKDSLVNKMIDKAKFTP